jgi:hypothetical protein
VIINLFLQKLRKNKSKLGKIITTHQTNLELSIVTLWINKLEETSFPHNIVCKRNGVIAKTDDINEERVVSQVVAVGDGQW